MSNLIKNILFQTLLFLAFSVSVNAQVLILDCDVGGDCSTDTDVSQFYINATTDSLCIDEADVKLCVSGDDLAQLFTSTDTDVDGFVINASQDSICVTENGKNICLSLSTLFDLQIFKDAVLELIPVDSSFSNSTCLTITPLPQSDGSVNFQHELDYNCIESELNLTDISGFYVNNTVDSLCIDEDDLHFCVSGTELAQFFTAGTDTDINGFTINSTSDSICVSENGSEYCLSIQSIFDLQIFKDAVLALIPVDSSFSITGCMTILPITQSDGSVNFQFDLDYTCIEQQLNIKNPDSLFSTDTCLIVSPNLQGDGSYQYVLDFNPNCLGGSAAVEIVCKTVFDTATIDTVLYKLAFEDCYENGVLVSRDSLLKECLNCTQDITDGDAWGVTAEDLLSDITRDGNVTTNSGMFSQNGFSQNGLVGFVNSKNVVQFPQQNGITNYNTNTFLVVEIPFGPSSSYLTHSFDFIVDNWTTSLNCEVAKITITINSLSTGNSFSNMQAVGIFSNAGAIVKKQVVIGTNASGNFVIAFEATSATLSRFDGTVISSIGTALTSESHNVGYVWSRLVDLSSFTILQTKTL